MNGRRYGSKGGDAETIRIRMLGGFRVSVGDRTLPEDTWRLKKAAALMKLLALAPNHHLHREQAMELLWPNSGTKAASNQLRKVLHAARRTLDPIEGSRYLASDNDLLVLCPGSSSWVDVEAFEEAASTARRERAPAAYRVAIELYEGDLLPEDRYEEWAEERRHALRRMFLSLLVDLSHVHQGGEEHEQAVEALQRAVAEEPTLEEAHASLMRLYALLGQVGAALSQYERLQELLLRQLGTKPSIATKRLRDQIASGGFDSALSSPTAPPPEEEPLDSTRHNLPATRTSFVGREQEMLEVKRELAMTRLLTLTGTGGSGKTRLALEVARDLVGAYADGVWLAELAPLSEGELVPQTVAQALGVKERPGERLTDTLVEFLRARHTLLVLDNCEHLVVDVAQVVDILLDACPRLRVLATSREALGIAGEMRQLVRTLSVPDPRQQLKAEELERYESVRLFVERAKYRDPAFVLTEQNVQAVAQICDRLDGIPLAIELAAARVGVPVEQIASRLDDSLGLLTTGSRTATARQRTLKGTLDWSYDLLSEPEQELFGRLSVFAGGWTLEASEAVAPGEGTNKSEVLDLLLGLVDKSLVVAEATGRGSVRHRMLEPVRQYSRNRLEESGEAKAIRGAHARFFLALAEEADSELRGPHQVAWLERLETEHDNARAALSWALERAEAELALRLGGALWWFWRIRGRYSEGRRWLEEALSIEDRVSPVSRAMALAGVGWLALDQADADRAEEACKEGLKLAHRAREESKVKLYLLLNLGYITLRRDHRRATELFQESLALSRDKRDGWGVPASLMSLALVSHFRGDSQRATELLEESIDLLRVQGNKYLLANGLVDLGSAVCSRGHLGRAAKLTEEGVGLLRELDARGDAAIGLCNLGWMALVQNDFGRAADLYKESLALAWDSGMNPVVQSVLEGFACVVGARKEAQRAARLWGAAQELHESKGISRDSDWLAEADARITAMRSSMGEQEWEEAFAEGKAMGLHEAVEYALAEVESTAPELSTQEQPSAATQPPTLTRREREVANLVARGLTNRQIAEEIVVSERTVDHHVSNILKKLNLSSREQVAYRLGDS